MTVRETPIHRGILSRMGNRFFLKVNDGTHIRLQINAGEAAPLVGRFVIVCGAKEGRVFVVNSVRT